MTDIVHELRRQIFDAENARLHQDGPGLTPPKVVIAMTPACAYSIMCNPQAMHLGWRDEKGNLAPEGFPVLIVQKGGIEWAVRAEKKQTP